MDELLQEINAIQPVSELQCDYAKTIVLLRALKAGTVTLDNVTMIENGWTVAKVEPQAEPAEDAAEPQEEGE